MIWEFLTLILVFIGAIYATKDYHISKRMVLLSLFVGFFLPFVVFMLPLAEIVFPVSSFTLALERNTIQLQIIDFEVIALNAFVRLQQTMNAFKILAPAMLSLLPGFATGAIVLKSLFPENPVLGFLIMAIPFVNLPMTMVFWCSLFQLISDWIVMVGLIAKVLSLSVFLLPFHHTFKVFRRSERYVVTVFPRIKIERALEAFVFLCFIAFFLMITFGFYNEIYDIMKDHLPGPIPLIRMVSDFLAQYFLALIVGCDTLLMIIVRMHKEEKEHPEAVRRHDARMDAMLKYLTAH